MKRPTPKAASRAALALARYRRQQFPNMARELVRKRWAALTPEQRKEAVRPLREGHKRYYERRRLAKLAEQSTRETPPDTAQ